MGSLSLAHPKDCPISAPKQAPLWSSPPEGADIPSFRSEHQKPESSFTLLCTFCPTCNPSKLQAAPPEDAARSPRFPSPLAPAAPGWAPCSHVRMSRPAPGSPSSGLHPAASEILLNLHYIMSLAAQNPEVAPFSLMVEQPSHSPGSSTICPVIFPTLSPITLL